jgi:predicted N-acetyltransferase YhbS
MNVAVKETVGMRIAEGFREREQEIVDLFAATFAASEGAEEGALIGRLVRDQFAGAAEGDIHVFTARKGEALVGGAVFTRLRYDADGRAVFILAPMAVAPDRQRQGIGQRLLMHGLGAVRAAGVDVALTYGDPNFYSRVGFRPITQDQAAAPFRLQHPEGWLGQSLTDAPLTPLQGPSRCVAALDDPVFW